MENANQEVQSAKKSRAANRGERINTAEQNLQNARERLENVMQGRLPNRLRCPQGWESV